MDTPFPFPWAQAVNFVLIVFCVTVPFVIVAHTTSVVTAITITFIAVHTHVMLNEVRPYVFPEVRQSYAYAWAGIGYLQHADLPSLYICSCIRNSVLFVWHMRQGTEVWSFAHCAATGKESATHP